MLHIDENLLVEMKYNNSRLHKIYFDEIKKGHHSEQNFNENNTSILQCTRSHFAFIL